MGFQKAKREQVYVKILLTSPSGGGKSYSALKIATGLFGKCGGAGIAYIGTEGSRDKYYANEFDYDLMQLDSYSVGSYMDAIDEAVDGGYKVLIIDSITPEWQWLNDQHSKAAGNSFQNWAPLKAKHKQFMDKILLSDIHVIACARGKAEWVVEDSETGKKVPKKVGMGADQDKNISFDYTVSFQLDQATHNATADKDNTHLFDEIRVLSEKDGELLYDWANSGEKPAPKAASKPSAAEKVDIDENEELIGTMKKAWSGLSTKAKTPIKKKLKELGVSSFDELMDLPTEQIKELSDLFKASDDDDDED